MKNDKEIIIPFEKLGLIPMNIPNDSIRLFHCIHDEEKVVRGSEKNIQIEVRKEITDFIQKVLKMRSRCTEKN